MQSMALFLFYSRSQLRHILCAVLLLALASFFSAIAGCGGSPSGTTPPPQGTPPANLVYPQTTITVTVGQAIATDTPTVTGTVTTYTVSPALPAGLGLSASTGAISGTPTAVTPQATYTITASNSAGSTTATLQIAVTLALPMNLVYPQTTITAIVGQVIATDTPTVTGTVASFAVSPALPAGLGLSASTGAISGTPTAVTPQASYTITASNSAGSTTATVKIAVNLAPPTNLVYPQTTITANVGQAIATDTPTVAGTVASYAVSPALPAGLGLSASTGAISGTPTAVTPQASYTITATNSAGFTTATVTITVASFTVFSLVDLGHVNMLAVMRLQPTRLFSQDTGGHWALWDYTATTELASGDPLTFGLVNPYPADMAGSVLAIGTANAVEVRSNVDGSLITTLTSPSLDPVPAVNAWWKLSTDGTYIASGYSSGLSVWSTSNGHLLFSRPGDYSRAKAFAASGQIQIALGPVGANVIETDSVPSGTSSIGPAFTANFNTWFTDGSHFLTNTPNLSPPATPPLFDVYTYSAATVQQGMFPLSDPTGLNGYGNWFWTYDFAVLTLYPIGATTPTATYTFGADTAVIPSGSTLGVLPYGTAAASTIDLSGSTPTLSSSTTLPVAYESAFAALSPSQWAVGNWHGVVLDGASAATATRFFGYGNAFSIAAAPGHVAVATAIGKILEFETSSPAIVGSINFTSSKLALSSDGSVLTAKASDIDSQYEPDRTLNLYSLPAGTVTNSFPYLFNDQLAKPVLFDFSFSGSGTALGQYLATYNGLNFDYTRQVTPPSGSPIIWSDNPPSGYYTGSTPIFLSPDGTLIAVSTGEYSSTSTTSIYKNGLLVATVNGFAVGWIDNNRVLVNTFGPLGTHAFPPYTGTVIYDATGAQLTTLTALPQLAPAQSPTPLGAVGFLPVDSNSIYSPATYSIYSLTTGATIWTEPLSHAGTTTGPYTGASAVSGSYIVFTSGTRVLVDLP